MRVVTEFARSYNTPVMRWIWGGILLTVVMSVNQNLVWGSGNGVERGPITWGLHARTLSDDARELVGQEIQKACPGAFEGLDPEKPVVVTSMIAYHPENTQDPVPTQRFLVELKRDTHEGAKKHDLAVIVATRKHLSEPDQVTVLMMGGNESQCR